MSTVLVRVQLFVFIHLFVYLFSLHNYFFLEKQLFEGLSLILLYIWEFFHKRIISASKKNMAKMRFRKIWQKCALEKLIYAKSSLEIY